MNIHREKVNSLIALYTRILSFSTSILMSPNVILNLKQNVEVLYTSHLQTSNNKFDFAIFFSTIIE